MRNGKRKLHGYPIDHRHYFAGYPCFDGNCASRRNLIRAFRPDSVHLLNERSGPN